MPAFTWPISTCRWPPLPFPPASLPMIKAEALEMTGNPVQAQALRLDSMGWARYGFGTDDEVRRHLTEIAVLSPLQGG